MTTPPGRVVRDEQGFRLELERSFDAGPEDVWAALTAPEQVARWFGVLSGDAADGSLAVRMTAEEGLTDPEPVLVVACAPPVELVVDLPGPDGTWRLATALQEQDRGTLLRLAQRLAEPYDASSIGPGWHYYLDRLAAVVEGDPVPTDFDAYLALAPAYALPD